jgi:hypothetical protein
MRDGRRFLGLIPIGKLGFFATLVLGYRVLKLLRRLERELGHRA